MEREINKFHALQLFTDTFAAETVHLTNQAVGIYIRLLCFAWTKNTKPFTTESAYRICQCVDDVCRKQVDYILQEFFKCKAEEDAWVHKRLVQEHEYLTSKYKSRSEAGKKGGLARSKKQAPIPIPNPKPNNNIYDELFEKLWSLLTKKRGSKFKAHEIWLKNFDVISGHSEEELAKIYNNQIKGIEEDKFVPHFSTWLSQRRWETDHNEYVEIPDLIERMKKLGYLYLGSEGQYEKFTKDGKNYRIDRYDEKHMLTVDQ
tara:strand:- start:39 stop:818 length:780 start_codon:yes stop_codon:yes gene_type:complete